MDEHLAFYGYTAGWAKTGPAVILMLGRVNSDGTTTSFFNNWSAPFINADQTKGATLTATVDVQPTETYLKLLWNGVDALGNPSSYSCDYHDTSDQRWQSGTGLGINGFCGNNNPTISAVTIDDLMVGTDIVAGPTFSSEGGYLISPVNVTISCATPGATIRYTTDGTMPTATNGTCLLYTSPSPRD